MEQKNNVKSRSKNQIKLRYNMFLLREVYYVYFGKNEKDFSRACGFCDENSTVLSDFFKQKKMRQEDWKIIENRIKYTPLVKEVSGENYFTYSGAKRFHVSEKIDELIRQYFEPEMKKDEILDLIRESIAACLSTPFNGYERDNVSDKMNKIMILALACYRLAYLSSPTYGQKLWQTHMALGLVVNCGGLRENNMYNLLKNNRSFEMINEYKYVIYEKIFEIIEKIQGLVKEINCTDDQKNVIQMIMDELINYKITYAKMMKCMNGAIKLIEKYDRYAQQLYDSKNVIQKNINFKNVSNEKIKELHEDIENVLKCVDPQDFIMNYPEYVYRILSDATEQLYKMNEAEMDFDLETMFEPIGDYGVQLARAVKQINDIFPNYYRIINPCGEEEDVLNCMGQITSDLGRFCELKLNKDNFDEERKEKCREMMNMMDKVINKISGIL